MLAPHSLLPMACLAVGAWLVSPIKNDVSIADSLGPLFILRASLTYATAAPRTSPHASAVVSLIAVWALRLAAHITWRSWGEPEDRRFTAMRARNEPRFLWKSLVLVFGLQAALAWVVSLSALAAVIDPQPWNWIDTLGVCVFAFGAAFEAGSDLQLVRFKADPAHRGQVMDRGLWRTFRHPDYFGEFCVWWGIFLIALSTQAWWAVASPVLMAVLLLKVSGVARLERDIAERRPGYREYIARTNTFFAGRARQTQHRRLRPGLPLN